LYSLPVQWLDWDAKARQFVKPPQLPRWALPSADGRWKDPRRLPTNGRELLLRLNKYEAAMVKEGRCKAGDLVKHVIEAGVGAGHPPDLEAWTAGAMDFAVGQAKQFADAHKAV